MNIFTDRFTNFLTMTWQQGWELLAWTMCYFLAAGTVVAVVGALVRFLCKRAAPQIRYAASLAVFATLAALPFGIALGLSQRTPVASVLNSIVIDLADTPIVAHSQVGPTKQTLMPIMQPLMEGPAPQTLARQNDGTMGRLVDRAIEFLPWVWLVGTPLTFLLLATGLIGSGRLRRRCTLLTEGPIVKTCERLRSTLAVSQRVGIAINERIATPLLIGIVRPLILLPPAALTGWSPDELEMVLLHELAHVRRWDNLVNFGQRLVESLLFFHPAVWWVSRWVRRDREECCDAVVVAQTEKPQAYAELLVALATPPSLSSPPLAGLALAQHPLAGRIRRILHLEEEKMLITRSTLGLVGFFVVAVLGVILWQPVAPTVAQESLTEVSEQKRITTEDTESTEERTSRGVPASNQPSPFPTLEAQRSADLAYKLLGVELEQLGNEELARVKAMKFAGGLRIGNSIHLLEYQGERPVARLEKGDLLVGLHVWPTTSLADVKKVLDRDDLQDLSPLKFYVIRKVRVSVRDGGGYGGEMGGLGGEMGGYGAEAKPKTGDKLVTGRIVVKMDAMKKSKGSVFGEEPFAPRSKVPAQTSTLAAGDSVKVVVTGAYPDQPIDNSYTIESMGTLALGPTYGRVKVAGLTLLEAEEAVKKQLSTMLKDVAVQITLVTKNGQHSNHGIRFGNQTQSKSDETLLVYDNRTFFDWKASWRRDLSPELRAKAVRAFVAFANAGKDKDAIDEIFAIVAEYDWTLRQNGFHASDPAKNACLAAFTGTQMRLNTDTAVKIIIAKKDSKNARVHDFVRLTLHELSQTTTEVNKLLREAFPKAKLPTIEEHKRFSGGFDDGGRTILPPSK